MGQLEGTDIEKTITGENHLHLRIPGTWNEIVRQQLAIPLTITVVLGLINSVMWFGGGHVTGSGLVVRLIFLLIWFVGIGGLVWIGQHIFGNTILDLTPEWTQVRYELFGLGFARRVSTAAIADVEIVNRYSVGVDYSFGVKGKPVDVEGIDLCAGGNTLKFGSYLPAAEKQQLVEEIRHYLATVPKGQLSVRIRATIKPTKEGIEIMIPARNFAEQKGTHAELMRSSPIYREIYASLLGI